jgi:hypothetical protein
VPSYISHFPEPFLADLVGNRCIPFIGAGFSKNAVVQKGDSMPLWEEVGRAFGDKIPGYRYQGALDAISAYEHEFSRVSLVEELSRLLLVTTSQPGGAHYAFARMPFDVVCSTNFDMLLERSYEGVGRYCRPVVEEDQLSVASPESAVTLLKFHGDVHHPKRMVLTEDDYSAFLARNPLFATFIANLLISRTPLFIGYSLDDPDFRLVWHLVRDRLGSLRRLGFTIKVAAPAWEISRFERRGVRVINLPGSTDDYGSILEEVLNELRELWESTTAKERAASQDSGLAELTLPRDAATRICAVLAPAESLGFYRRNVFPLIEQLGFTPVSMEDLIRPGDSIPAALSTLVERAEIIIVDVSSAESMFEGGYVFHQRSDIEKVLVILGAGADVPIEWVSRARLMRPGGEDDIDDFLVSIHHWLAGWAERLFPELELEPKRLLDKKEYRPAVISAVALLEHSLRSRIRLHEVEQSSHRLLSLMQLIKEATRRDMFERNEAQRVMDWVRLRNELVHRQAQVPAKTARAIVDGILSIIRRWKGREY